MTFSRSFLFLIFLFFSFSTFSQQYPEMVPVTGGAFLMGNNREAADQKEHQVTLKSYHMAKTETTVLQWKFFCESAGRKMPDAPAWGWNDEHPIVNVSWNDAAEYVSWLSKKTGKTYRLPTEAEWEYAARGGTFVTEETSWFSGNGKDTTHPAGRKKPNELGIFDMLGNAAEWCQDRYGSYPSYAVSDPVGHKTSLFRIVRGGSWYNHETRCTSTFREKCAAAARFDYLGFRVVTVE